MAEAAAGAVEEEDGVGGEPQEVGSAVGGAACAAGERERLVVEMEAEEGM